MCACARVCVTLDSSSFGLWFSWLFHLSIVHAVGVDVCIEMSTFQNCRKEMHQKKSGSKKKKIRRRRRRRRRKAAKGGKKFQTPWNGMLRNIKGPTTGNARPTHNWMLTDGGVFLRRNLNSTQSVEAGKCSDDEVRRTLYCIPIALRMQGHGDERPLRKEKSPVLLTSSLTPSSPVQFPLCCAAWHFSLLSLRLLTLPSIQTW